MMNRLAFILVAALVVGCAGGGTTPGIATQQPAPQASSPAQKMPQSVSVSFNIVVPTTSGAIARRVPNYVSASTKSASITVNGASGATVNCTTTCSGTVNAPAGSDTFGVKLYDATNGSGNLLSTGSTTQTIVIGQANSVNMTFNGVVASLAISLGTSGTAGSAATIPVTVNALDADGNTIVGPGVYVNASGAPLTVALSDSDSSGATTLLTTSVTQPTSGITMSYSGLAIVPATIGASATGVTENTTTFTPTLQPIVVTTGDTQNPNFVGVNLYATSGAGSTGSFTVSEVGWTNAPYNKALTETPASGCSSVASLAPATGTSFTATAVAAASAGSCTAALSDGAGQSQAVTLAYSRYVYTGADQSLTLPAGVTQITVDAVGANGSDSSFNFGGHGEEVLAALPVSSGVTLYVLVGGYNGFNGGGRGGAGFPFNGGGASDIRVNVNDLSHRIIVAAGGGAAGNDGVGGNAGYANGQAGTCGSVLCSTNGYVGGGGATQSVGGAGGNGAIGDGAFGLGGNASSGVQSGAGGGGYYGGGAGGTTAGGGGGSSNVLGPASLVSDNSSSNGQCDTINNGCITIKW